MTVYDSRKKRTSAGIGSAQKPWVADFQLPGGGRKRKAFRLKSEAEAYEAGERATINAGTYINPREAEKMTIGELYASWMQLLTTQGLRGKPIAASTEDNYRKNWHKHIEPHWAFTPLAKVNPRGVAKWVTELEIGNGKQTGANTRRRVAQMFGRLMNHAVYLELLPKNPAKDATGRAGYIPKAPVEKRRAYLTMPELQALAERCAPWSDLVMLAGTTGLRWGEVTALRASDIRKMPDGYLLDVVRSWKAGDTNSPSPNTKNGEKRTVPVPAKVADMVFQARPRKDGLLFQSGNYTPDGHAPGRLHHSNFAARVLRPATEGMDPAPTFHDLRHTAVSLILHRTKDVKLAQRIAGHASATMTLDTYADLFEESLFAASSALDDLIE
ncbi:tyrosine-type recombinase/integrase [Arthrobacter sp. I2-34]|uniref:Tyrosine-type recombinase/integrase n=1 Tax=Arthrobacter hankyongi TaxID=2904801 RepID=A0ABS9LDK1_9MICC|nr:tyrosine-type recombinase/integrase [Arthrobacter hankyongi]MCG2624703.1 tyrosine-type recombinase/integrase [Arthrobacter hankyongi]